VKRLLRRTERIPTARLVQVSAVLTLVGLAMMAWSMVEPTPLPVILAMSVGQAFGTLAFALYGLAIWRDLRRARRARRDSAPKVET
jgi:hypothetical protein